MFLSFVNYNAKENKKQKQNVIMGLVALAIFSSRPFNHEQVK